jgi:DNA-binding transcriptional LysR family regulator
MDTAEIQTFLAIAELGSFTRAAQRLHRSQPAISRRLDILEHELGAPLFERLRGRARLTEAGSVLLPYAEAVLASLRDGQDAVRVCGRASRARFRWRSSARLRTRTSCTLCAGSRCGHRMSGCSSVRPPAGR